MANALVIFDCDGVLVDSEPLASRALRDALAELGLPLSQAKVDEKFRGRSLSDIVVEVEELLGTPLPGSFLDDLDERTFAAFRGGLLPVEGVRDAVVRVIAEGHPVCVASSGSLEKIRLTLGLTGLLEFFDGRLYSASEVAHGKPKPDLFLHAAERMGTTASASIVVEDSLPGVRAGLRAGSRVLAYASPSHPERAAHLAALAGMGLAPFSDMRDLPGLVDS